MTGVVKVVLETFWVLCSQSLSLRDLLCVCGGACVICLAACALFALIIFRCFALPAPKAYLYQRCSILSKHFEVSAPKVYFYRCCLICFERFALEASGLIGRSPLKLLDSP